MLFIDRKNELNMLSSAYNRSRAELVLITGRRRIGKTELIKKCINEHKGVLLTCREESEKLMLERFSVILGNYFHDDFIIKNSIKSWDSFFEYLYKNTLHEKSIIAIDEFPYALNNKSLQSILQDYWDNKLNNTRIFLILSGSNISMMENLSDYKSPLYGRRTGQITLKEFPFVEVLRYFGDPELAVKYYSVYGGTPAYIMEVNKTKSFTDNIMNTFLKIDSFINQDVLFLLKEELKEPRYYFSILEAISSGKTALGEIISYTGLQRNLTSKYISVLIDLDYIRREIPITSTKSRKGIYLLKDNMFNFYFRYIYPNYNLIEMGNENMLINIINENINTYIGHIFEYISIQFLLELNKKNQEFDRIGKWWYKDIGIDIITINNKTNQITFYECKWKELNEQDLNNTLLKLREKAKSFEWHENRTERYGIIAKKIKGKERIKGNYLLYDLSDFKYIK